MRTIPALPLLRSSVFLFAGALALACGGDGDDTGATKADAGAAAGADAKAPAALVLPTVDCETGTIPEFKAVDILVGYMKCHSSELTGADRNRAPVGVDFDKADTAGKYARKAASVVHLKKMPPASAKATVTEQQKETLYKWALCSGAD